MGRPSRFPTLIDYCLTINISDLKRSGVLKPLGMLSASIYWAMRGVKIASISVTVNTMEAGKCYVELDYNCEGRATNYRVPLVPGPSNLGKGKIWYFICPRTNKRCRKLYLVDSLFLHRTAHPEALYELQTWSKESRLAATLPMYQGLFADQIYGKYCIKYFKHTYQGKLTKRYIRFLKKLGKLGVDMEIGI